MHGAGVAQLSLTQSDWVTAVRSQAEAKDVFSSICVQTGSEVHPFSYLLCARGKALPGRDTDHSLQVVPRLGVSGRYVSSPFWRLNCVAG
jgi:hypothetical protein